jgi:hypothetical protein
MRIDRFAQSLTSVESHLAGFRSFRLAESFEASDSILKFGQNTAASSLLTKLYPASLPYAIAGDLEDDDGDTPLVGMQRYWSDTYLDPTFSSSVAPVRACVDPIDGGRIISSVPAAGKEGRRSAAQTHGGVPTDDAVVESTQYILINGLP